jgi:hypothetical protein
VAKWHGTGKAGEGYLESDSACEEALEKDAKASCLACPLAKTYCMALDDKVPKVRVINVPAGDITSNWLAPVNYRHYTDGWGSQVRVERLYNGY